MAAMLASSLGGATQQCVAAMECGEKTQHSTNAQVSGVCECIGCKLYVCVVVDCGSPELPSNATMLAAAEGTDGSSNTEGATVSFWCEEPLRPTITCTRIGNTGQWKPDPAMQCSDEQGT